MIRVKRKGYTRKDGTRVRKTTYLMEDRGRPGRGPKTLPTPRRGALRGWKADDPASKRRRILDSIVRNESYPTATQRLTLLKNISTSRKADRAANADLDYLHEKYRE